MENSNRQGKTNKQYKDSTTFFLGSALCLFLMILIMTLFSSCYGTLYLSDAEYSDVRESHASVTYHNSLIYWGWNSGYYYYYGKPHYYPWYYYYNTCPPSHYSTTTHIIISKPVNRSIYRPSGGYHNRPIYKSNTNRNIKTNVNRNRVNIKTNNGSKRSNKTTIRKRPK